VPTEQPQRERDGLAFLAGAHWAVAGLAFLSASVPAFYASLGLDMVFAGTTPARVDSGWRVLGTGLGWVAAVFAYVMLLTASARSLRLRRHYRLVVATNVLSLAFLPFGTVLGLTTLVVLRHREVREQFGRAVAHRGPRSVSPPPAAP